MNQVPQLAEVQEAPLSGFILYFLQLGTFGFGGPIALASRMAERKIHNLAIDPKTHRVYTPEEQENGRPVARMIAYEPVTKD